MSYIRQLVEKELNQAIKLSSFAFQYELTHEELVRKRQTMKAEQYWGTFIDHKLISTFRLIPLEVWIHGQAYKMGGIASVATWPEYRRLGSVSKMLDFSFKLMKDQNQVVSMLHPFSIPFYRKYGYETFTEKKTITIMKEQWPSFGPSGGRVKRLEKKETELPLLNSIYEQAAIQFSGMLKREDEWWLHSVFRDKHIIAAVYFNPNEQPTGYVLYKLKNGNLEVQEMFALDYVAEQSLWNFIGNHDSMSSEIIYTTNSYNSLAFLLNNSKVKQEVSPYFMARIVDVMKFFQQYSFSKATSEWRFNWTITDAHAPWNDGIYDIVLDQQGKVEINNLTHATEKGNGETDGLSCDIQTLTVLLLGYQRPKFLQWCGRLQGSNENIEKLEHRIPCTSTYFADFF